MDFYLEVAASRGTPPMRQVGVVADAQASKARADVALLETLTITTEAHRPRWRQAWRHAWNSRYFSPEPSGSGIAYSPGLRMVQGGIRHGSNKIRGVCGRRWFSFAVFEKVEGPGRVAVIAVHTPPGGWARIGTPAQRLRRKAIRREWRAYMRRVDEMAGRFIRQGVPVVVAGDINRPGRWTLRGFRRVSGPGLIYVGVSAGRGGSAGVFRQRADHAARRYLLHV